MSLMNTRRSGPSGNAPFSPSGAIENLSFSQRHGVHSKRHSTGPESNLVSVPTSGNMRAIDKEDVMKAFFDIKERIASKFRGLSNEKEVLDLCDVFSVGLCAIIGHKFGPNSDFFQRFGGAAARIADFSGLQSLSLALERKRLLTADDYYLNKMTTVDTQRKLRLCDDAKELHKLHMIELLSLTAQAVLMDVRPTFDRHMKTVPFFGEDFLVLWVAVLRKLFPVAYGYVVTEGYCDVFDLWLPYAQVLKRTPDAPEGKVLLVVMGRIQGWDDDFDAAIDFGIVTNLWRLGELVFEQQVTYHPDRVFWLGFRGVHFGCGWQVIGYSPVRCWPEKGKLFQDVRSEMAASMLLDFAKTVSCPD